MPANPTSEDALVEAVARAIAAHRGIAAEHCTDGMMAVFKRDARAAITALRASEGDAEKAEGAREESALNALTLWFFRDLTEDQRVKLFTLWLGGEAAKEANTHGIQQMLFRRMVRRTAMKDRP